MTDALLKLYLDAMPLGNYHVKDEHPLTLYRDGKCLAFLTGFADHPDKLSTKALEGCVQALVLLLNQRTGTARFDHA